MTPPGPISPIRNSDEVTTRMCDPGVLKGTKLKKELGFRSYDALLNHVALEIRALGAVPPADYDLIFGKLETRPAIITGQSGQGKTITISKVAGERLRS